jgi:NitT/TauT family transport system substrate-binding protein
MTGKRLHRLPLMAVVGSLVALGTPGIGHAQDLQKVTVLTSNDTSCGPYPQVTADEFGFFEKEGLEVTILPSNTKLPFVAFLRNGQADLAMFDPGQVLQAAASEQPIAVIYEAYQGASDGIVVPADSDITSVADLKGKTVGLASDRDRLTLAVALSTVGLALSDVNTAVIGDSGPTVTLSLRGDVQAYAAANSEFATLTATGFQLRNITPVEVSGSPGNSWTVWGPNIEEKRDLFERFLRAWAKGQHAGVMDTKAVMSACKKRIPEQWEEPGRGESVVNNSVFNTQIRRTVKYGELQRDVWENIQKPYIEFGEIQAPIEIDVFLDDSFTDAANDFTTDEVKEAVKAWKAENKDILIN